MSDESGRFRQRARECRDLSKRARDSLDRAQLENIAFELDAEAAKIEAEEEAKPNHD